MEYSFIQFKCSKSGASQKLVPYPPHILPTMGKIAGECAVPSETCRLCQLYEEERKGNVHIRLYP